MFVYDGYRVKVKVTGAKMQGLKSLGLFPQCKISIGNNSGSIKQSHEVFLQHRVFFLWRIEWCDCHLCHVTRSDHA